MKEIGFTFWQVLPSTIEFRQHSVCPVCLVTSARPASAGPAKQHRQWYSAQHTQLSPLLCTTKPNDTMLVEELKLILLSHTLPFLLTEGQEKEAQNIYIID